MQVARIEAPAEGVALTLTVVDAYHPQSIVGNVWRYVKRGDGWAPDGKVGVVTPLLSVVPLGGVRSVEGLLFVIVAAVVNQGDAASSPYQVVVSVLQGDSVLHHEVPSEGGSGLLGARTQPFVYRFVVSAKA